MPKYLVMLRCSRARSNANRHRQETPAYLPYRIEAPKALDAADKAKEQVLHQRCRLEWCWRDCAVHHHRSRI